MKRFSLLVLFVAVAFWLLPVLGPFAADTSAAMIVDPANITAQASSQWWEAGAVNALYDGTGMTGDQHVGISYSGGTYPAMWGVGNNPVVSSTMGINDGADMMGYAIFSFDQSYPLDEITVWNVGGEWSALGSKDARFETSTSENPSTPADWTTIWDGSLARGPSTDGSMGFHGPTNVLDANGVSARHVAVSIRNSYYDIGTVYAFLSEVQFVTEADLPPPSPQPSGPDLNVTVGSRTRISTVENSLRDIVTVSRTGTVAAFYDYGHYRISTDKGLTWGQEMAFPLYPGTVSVGLAEGGVVAMTGNVTPVGGGNPPAASDFESTRILFSDDLTSYSTSTSSVSLPNAVQHTKYATFWPVWDKGKIIQLDNGDLLAPMYGNLRGDDNVYRAMLMHSTDEGQSWQYRSTMGYSATDPNPELHPSGDWAYCGFPEPSITLLANGQLLAMMRTQGKAEEDPQPPLYRPMYVAWSDDLGLTWTEPEPTSPHLLNVWPTLQTLDNGVVAVAYGRPGVNVAFSTDNGHTWSDIETFSTLPTTPGQPGSITGYADMVKVGPNDLVMITSHEGGTYVYPIRVDIRGDFDSDGDVDGDDFLIWQNGFPIFTGAALLDGDADVDGDVDGDDFLIWQNSFPYPTAISSVPEPNSLALLALGGLIMLRRRTTR